MLKNPKRNNPGFTLIELLVVIAIIGVLSTLAVYSTNVARQKSRDAKRITDISQTQTALELYFIDQQGYPVVATALVLGAGAGQALSSAGFTTTAGIGATVYMGQVPANITPAGSDYIYTSTNADGTDCIGAPCASYNIGFELEGITGRLLGGSHTANPAGIQ